MRILVLGGCGFIGSHIVDELLLTGDDVRVFGRSHETSRRPLPDVDYRIADFADIRQLNAALEGVDVVIHAISTSNPGRANLDPVEDARGNLINTIRLLGLMRKRGMHRILFLSSGGTVYGNPATCPVRENASLHPISSYGIVKVAIENYLFMYQQLYGFQPVILRPSNPYGPGQDNVHTLGAITCFMRNILHGKPLATWGDGRNIRDYLPVMDLARLCSMAARSSVCGTFNAGSGKGYSLIEVIAMISSVSGKKVKVRYQAARPFDVRAVVLDCTRAKDMFGWTVHTELDRGIKKYWQWMLEDES